VAIARVDNNVADPYLITFLLQMGELRPPFAYDLCLPAYEAAWDQCEKCDHDHQRPQAELEAAAG
jgi:hypothetical protein